MISSSLAISTIACIVSRLSIRYHAQYNIGVGYARVLEASGLQDEARLYLALLRFVHLNAVVSKIFLTEIGRFAHVRALKSARSGGSNPSRLAVISSSVLLPTASKRAFSASKDMPRMIFWAANQPFPLTGDVRCREILNNLVGGAIERMLSL